MRPLSGIQKEVLSLYRTMLRTAIQKDAQNRMTGSTTGTNKQPTWHEWTSMPVKSTTGTSTRVASSTVAYARREFRKQAMQVPKSDFKTIEYKLRQGHKKVKLLQMPGVQVVRGVSHNIHE